MLYLNPCTIAAKARVTGDQNAINIIENLDSITDISEDAKLIIFPS